MRRTRNASGSSITVGSLTLQSCVNGGFLGYCGSLPRALDPTGKVPGTINIGFEWYPASDTSVAPAGTILAEEGGPGSASTGSRSGYLTLFGPLENHRNVVIIDKRGTGLSQPVDCKAVRRPFDMSIGVAERCGRELGDSADLYGTALAADDIAAVLAALQTGAVNYYGDSYATFFWSGSGFSPPGAVSHDGSGQCISSPRRNTLVSNRMGRSSERATSWCASVLFPAHLSAAAV